ncbi:MAG: hypothetical protein SOR94_07275 [Lawsonella sp.]|nr:hypothetical protein [Lawsonella sp.]MDY2979811.1 hypothetical protein [Lawsonella sp.]
MAFCDEVWGVVGGGEGAIDVLSVVDEFFAGGGAVKEDRVFIVGVGVETGSRRAVCPVFAGRGVIVEDWHGDAVCTSNLHQVCEVVFVRFGVVGLFIFHLVQEDGAAAGGDLVAGQDVVDAAEPGALLLPVGAGGGGAVGLPGGHATHGDFGVDVGAGAGDDVEAFLGCHAEEEIDIADAGEVEGKAGGALVVAPEEVEGDGVEAGSLHLLENIPPVLGGGEAPVVEFSRPDGEALTVHYVRVLIPGDAMGLAIVAGELVGRSAEPTSTWPASDGVGADGVGFSGAGQRGATGESCAVGGGEGGEHTG